MGGGGKEDGSVRRDKTVGVLSAPHLVRHLVSAQSVIKVSAEAEVCNKSQRFGRKTEKA